MKSCEKGMDRGGVVVLSLHKGTVTLQEKYRCWKVSWEGCHIA